MEIVSPTLINLSSLQILGLLHPYFLLAIFPFNIYSFICIGFFSWVVWETSQGSFSCTPTILSFVPKATATLTPHRTTICNNVTNIVACLALEWVVGTSNTSLVNFMSPWLRVSLTLCLCLLIFESSCSSIWRTPPWLTSFTCTFLGFMTKPTACVTFQLVKCGNNMSNI